MRLLGNMMMLMNISSINQFVAINQKLVIVVKCQWYSTFRCYRYIKAANGLFYPLGNWQHDDIIMSDIDENLQGLRCTCVPMLFAPLPIM